MNVFETLSSINVNEHTETKNGLTYLSWAWAWAEAKKRFPAANFTVYERPDGVIYWTDGRTAWVKTGVTIEDLEHIEYLPIMDFKNRSIPVDQITSTDVNKAIQRSLTKALARHGLGLYIYAGEDLPEEPSKMADTGENSRHPKKDTSTAEKPHDDTKIDEKQAYISEKELRVLDSMWTKAWNEGKVMSRFETAFPQAPNVTKELYAKAMQKLAGYGD